jgi:hypothetical protein
MWVVLTHIVTSWKNTGNTIYTALELSLSRHFDSWSRYNVMKLIACNYEKSYPMQVSMPTL